MDSPSGLHGDYWELIGNAVWTPHRVHVDSLWTPWKPVGECKVLIEIETDCKALQDILMSDDLNATHTCWCDGILAHQTIDVQHIPGRINLVDDAFSRKDEGLFHSENNGSSWSIIPDWEHTCGLYYDLFSVETTVSTLHSTLREWFVKEHVFLEVIDALLGIMGTSTESKCKRANPCAEGYFIEDGKLWCLGGATPTCSVTRRECITKLEATQLTQEEH